MGTETFELSFSSPVLIQFLRFAAVGVLGTGAHYLSLATLVAFGIDPTLSTSLGAVVGALLNYWLNYHFTFRSQRQHRVAASRFFAIAALGWLLNAALFHVLHTVIGLGLWAAQLITTGLVLLWNFAGNRWWTFGEKPHG